MASDKSPTLGPAQTVLAAKIARRFYMDGVSKRDIAEELGLSRFKVARTLEHARSSGLVRIELHYDGDVDLDLSVQLSTSLGIRRCLVLGSSVEDDDASLRSGLARVAAGLLEEIVEPDDVLGLSWSRTLLQMRPHLRDLAPCAVVQLTGALSRADVDESSIELVRDVARIAGGPVYCFYAPMIVRDAETAASLRSQNELARAMAKWDELTKAIVTLGAWEPGQSTVVDAVCPEEFEQAREAGVVCEVAGMQLASSGEPIRTQFSERVIGIDPDRLRRVPEIVAIAYGAGKVAAVQAAVRAGLVTTLVTHRALAVTLLNSATS
jgi:DNA-binding transcriptional regulator LsrR (DeoR family)